MLENSPSKIAHKEVYEPQKNFNFQSPAVHLNIPQNRKSFENHRVFKSCKVKIAILPQVSQNNHQNIAERIAESREMKNKTAFACFETRSAFGTLSGSLNGPDLFADLPFL